jgi:dsRNA-specific ribonuclease
LSAPEHAVIVRYPLAGGHFGEEQQRQAIYDLATRLTEAIDAADAGDFDGHEFGGGEAVLYAYGPDATRLFTAMEPHLRAFPTRPAHATLRLGAPDDPTTAEQRIDQPTSRPADQPPLTIKSQTLRPHGQIERLLLQRHAAVEALAWVPGDKLGPMSREIGHIASTLPVWAARQSWIAESTAVAHGLVGEPLPNRVVADLFRRVVGLLCVLDLYDSATRLAGGLLADARRTEVVHNPVTALRAAAMAAPVTYAYEREGPDHQATYHAPVTDTRGRRTIGTGRSKKAAAHEAARKFVQRYYPVAMATVTAVRPAAPAREMLGYRDHTWTVDRIQRAFALPPAARPLLFQALIHSSWTYEHQSETARAGHRSNQVLGLVGLYVLEHEYGLAMARRAVVERPDTLLVVTLPNDAYERACRWADPTSGLLLGAGQSVVGTSPEITAKMFQAVMAAVYLSKRRSRSVDHAARCELAALFVADRPRR